MSLATIDVHPKLQSDTRTQRLSYLLLPEQRNCGLDVYRDKRSYDSLVSWQLYDWIDESSRTKSRTWVKPGTRSSL